jgi:hypothetical protein
MEDAKTNDDLTVKPEENPLLDEVKKTFLQEFFPIPAYTMDSIFMSSEEIFQMIQSIYPCYGFTIEEVAKWLHSEGFKFSKVGDTRFLWYMLKKPVNPVNNIFQQVPSKP